MKKKKREMFSNVSNKLAYTLIVILSLALFGIGVYAATYSASGAGHPYTEISTCGANQILQMNSAGNAWTCVTSSSSIPTPPSCSTNQILTWTGSAWSCKTGTAIYKCPAMLSTNYCANILLARNGVSPCVGQLTTNSGSACYYTDANCNFDPITGIGSWATCNTLVGYVYN